MQVEIDAVEFQEWQELYKIEPWGDDWLQAGTIAATNVNLWSKRKVKPEQFIPKTKARKSAEQIEAEMQRWAKLHNARIEKQERESSQRSARSIPSSPHRPATSRKG